MNLYKDLINEIDDLTKKYSINEAAEIRISKIQVFDYQINLFVKYKSHENIEIILQEIKTILSRSEIIEEFEIADNLFINLRIDVTKIFNKLSDVEQTIKVANPKDIIIDYGGPNIGKPLHVGHLRPLNIGRSI